MSSLFLLIKLAIDLSTYWSSRASLVAQMVKNTSAMQETCVWSPSQEDPLKKEMATHSSSLASRFPQTEEPGWLQSMVLKRVRHDWATNTHILISILSVFISLIILDCFTISLFKMMTFVISVLLLFGLLCFFSSFLRWKLRSLISGLYFFPVQILSLYVLYCFSCMSVFLYVVFSFSFNSKYSHFPFDLFFDPGVIEKYVL